MSGRSRSWRLPRSSDERDADLLATSLKPRFLRLAALQRARRHLHVGCRGTPTGRLERAVPGRPPLNNSPRSSDFSQYWTPRERGYNPALDLTAAENLMLPRRLLDPKKPAAKARPASPPPSQVRETRGAQAKPTTARVKSAKPSNTRLDLPLLPEGPGTSREKRYSRPGCARYGRHEAEPPAPSQARKRGRRSGIRRALCAEWAQSMMTRTELGTITCCSARAMSGPTASARASCTWAGTSSTTSVESSAAGSATSWRKRPHDVPHEDEAANPPDPNDRATLESEFALELRTRDRERKLIRKIDEA